MLTWSSELAAIRGGLKVHRSREEGLSPRETEKGHRCYLGWHGTDKRKGKVEGPQAGIGERDPVCFQEDHQPSQQQELCLKSVSWKLEVLAGSTRRLCQRNQWPAPSRKGSPKLATTPGIVVQKEQVVFSISNVRKSKGKRNFRSFLDCFKVGSQWTTVHGHLHLNKDRTPHLAYSPGQGPC